MNTFRSAARRFLILLVMMVPFAAHAGNGTCVRSQAEVCIDGPGTRNINGLNVYRSCWRYQATFTCQSASYVNDCQPLVDRGCSQIGSSCIDTNAQGACMLFGQTYQCRVSGGSTSTITNCGSQQFCLDGRCFNTAHAPDPDFARVVTGLEIQREAGKYIDPSALAVFKGYDNRCRKKFFGLVNCCKGAGAGGSLFSNLDLILGAGGQAVGALGSSYTYDALFTSDAPNMVIAGFQALFSAGGGSSALGGLLAGDVSVASFVGSLVPGPWTIAMLAIQFSGILSCEQAEQVLAMKRDNRLCHGVGSYCSARVPIIRVCTETTQSYCCFNSRLARILNEQGRAQLGRGWGGAESPDCSGFTIPQLQALDFSRMDLAEFYAEIAPTLPDAGATQQRAQQKANSYFRP
ncbi:MAG: conjugal transfer protein TraN [Burkholderiales bacterium]|nr:conjugal transfer protein TraN [Burkholderiales bacterium]